MYDWVAWLKLKREKVSYIELQVRFWSWLTIKGRNMKAIPKMFGDRNSVGRNPRSHDAFLFIVWFFNLQRNIIYRKSWLKVITKVNELKNKAWKTWNVLSKIIPIKSQWQDEKVSSSITAHSLWLRAGTRERNMSMSFQVDWHSAPRREMSLKLQPNISAIRWL